MQFYLDGYRPGDPDIQPAAEGTRSTALPDTVDVLIVGSGPAGTVLAAQLSAFPAIRTRLVERRDGPLMLGQADGVACRTVEMFDAFGMSARLVREGYWVNETTFWRPSADDRSKIARAGRVQDTEDDLSEFPHRPARRHRGPSDALGRTDGELETPKLVDTDFRSAIRERRTSRGRQRDRARRLSLKPR